MKRVLSLIATALLLCLCACNTIQGIGKDVQAAGSAISGAANKH